jgi:hypothetical protein
VSPVVSPVTHDPRGSGALGENARANGQLFRAMAGSGPLVDTKYENRQLAVNGERIRAPPAFSIAFTCPGCELSFKGYIVSLAQYIDRTYTAPEQHRVNLLTILRLYQGLRPEKSPLRQLSPARSLSAHLSLPPGASFGTMTPNAPTLSSRSSCLYSSTAVYGTVRDRLPSRRPCEVQLVDDSSTSSTTAPWAVPPALSHDDGVLGLRKPSTGHPRWRGVRLRGVRGRGRLLRTATPATTGEMQPLASGG